jgi:serine/threonine protein kinase
MLVAGRYLLTEEVGQGGMGRVWRGHDQLLDRVVAVKEVILPSRTPQERASLLARTMREARAAARLDHRGVITIHDVVEHEDSPWIVMQFVDGPSLQSRIDSEGRLSWREVADVGGQVAEALAVAHAAGIVHRDLKPDNILLSGDRAIVTDFGIARIMDSAIQLTSTGRLVGTPAFMAPEQLDGGDAGPAADLWALGATLYTAVEGVPPFVGATMMAVLAAIVTKMPPRPQHAGALEDVVARLLARDPAERPDALTAARSLAAARAGQAAWDPGSRPPQDPEPEPASFPVGGTVSGARRRRQAAVIISAAAILAATAGAGAALLTSSRSPGPASSSGRPPAGRLTGAPASGRTPASQHPSQLSPTGPVTKSLLATITDPHGTSPYSMVFGPDGTLAVGDGNGSTYLWNGATRSLIDTFKDPGSHGVGPVAFGPDDTLAVGDINGSTYLWNTTIKSVINTFPDPNGQQVLSVAFGPHDTLAAADLNGNVYLWNTATSGATATLPAPTGLVPTALAFGPDGTLAVADFHEGPAGVFRGTTYLWNTSTKTVITTLPDPKGLAPTGLAFGPDGTLAIDDANGSTYLWNTATRSVIATLPAPKGQGHPAAMAFGPDGILAVADTTCTGACYGYGDPVTSVTYLWNTATMKIVASLPIPDGVPPQCLAFGPDDTIAVGIANGTTYLWRISS